MLTPKQRKRLDVEIEFIKAYSNVQFTYDELPLRSGMKIWLRHEGKTSIMFGNFWKILGYLQGFQDGRIHRKP